METRSGPLNVTESFTDIASHVQISCSQLEITQISPESDARDSLSEQIPVCSVCDCADKWERVH